MKKKIADILICPVCLPQEITLDTIIKKEDQGDIIMGEMVCRVCGKVYPIKDGMAFLNPSYEEYKPDYNRYETSPVVSSYLWSHYGDLLGDEQASDAYTQWADLMAVDSGFCLDIGAAVGRFSFEMSTKKDFVVGIDNSVSFIRAARDLMIHGHKDVSLIQEGLLTSEERLQLSEKWFPEKVEFLVADAQRLPFRSGIFSSMASLNLLDKVPSPMKHLIEANRVASKQGVEFLCSDPYSWSTDTAEEEEWLGGKENGDYCGYGIDNLIALLKGEKGNMLPKWTVKQDGSIWWKIRAHRNYFELIRSCFILAER
jgi:uncharacterized protein YbaR (Trm112 family)